jgi:2-alkyl-3-oxoalkanoate reductase
LTYLITGATGLLGSHLTELLVARGETPRALVRPNDPINSLMRTRVDVTWGDMADRGALEAAVDGVDCVLHCAARTGPWGDEAEYERTNVHGLKTLVEAAVAAGVRRFVHVSSITVHGNDVRGAGDEASPLRVEPNPYSRSKVAGERLLGGMIHELGAPITIVRPGWIYGPRDEASFARFARMVEQGQMIVVGSGGNHVPLIYVTDAAQGILLAGQAPHAVGKAYLLVNDEPVTQRDYLNAIAAELGVPAPRRSLPYGLAVMLGTVAETGARLVRTRQPPPVMRYGLKLLGGENRFTISRARQELGFSPQVILAEGVKRSVEWYRTSRTTTAATNEAA